MKVKKLLINKAKGMPSSECEFIYAQAGRGITGDRFADGGQRQAAIADSRITNLSKEEQESICGKKFKANILIENFEKEGASKGDILNIGKAVLEITVGAKECHPDVCDIAAAGGRCAFKGATVFGKIIKSGEIKKEDSVELIRKEQ